MRALEEYRKPAAERRGDNLTGDGVGFALSIAPVQSWIRRKRSLAEGARLTLCAMGPFFQVSGLVVPELESRGSGRAREPKVRNVGKLWIDALCVR